MSEDTDRDTKRISAELNELKEWKQNIGLKAVISAEEYKKELNVMKAQSEQFKNELIETQKESRIYQEKLEHIKLEKDDINEELKQLKEDINIVNNEQIEKDRLSQEAITMKQEEIEILSLNVESLQIEKQSLESQLASSNQQSKAEEMELNECNQEIQQLKMERDDIMRQLNEYKENKENDKDINEMISKQLKSQQIEYQNMKQENNKINQQLIELQLTLKNIKQENQSLIKDNDQYKEILTKLREKENNLKEKVSENELKLQQIEIKYHQLSTDYEQEHDQRIHFEMNAAHYQEQIHDMEQVSISSNVRVSPTQKPSFLPQKTVMRLNVSKESKLTVPTITNFYRDSTRKILSSMMSSVLDVQNTPQTLFASIADPDSNQELIAASPSFNDADSVCTDASFQTANEFDINRDGIIDDNIDDITIQLTKETKRRQSCNALENPQDASDQSLQRSPSPKAINLNAKSLALLSPLVSPRTQKKPQSPFGATFDPKVFEKKLQEEIKKEMDSLEKQLQREYNAEFEKKKGELIGAHEESLAFVTNLNHTVRKELEELKKKYQEINKENVKLPEWTAILEHIFAI